MRRGALDLPLGLGIMTIHALCGALLRRFPLEAGVAPHFETIDERSAGELMQEALQQVLRAAARGPGRLDVQLVIHGSIAHAPWAALYLVRDDDGDAIGGAELPGTPLLQLQPSTPADRWQVAAQANLRVQLELHDDRRHLTVLPA